MLLENHPNLLSFQEPVSQSVQGHVKQVTEHITSMLAFAAVKTPCADTGVVHNGLYFLSSFPSFLLTIPCFHTNLVTLSGTRETSEVVIIPSGRQL